MAKNMKNVKAVDTGNEMGKFVLMIIVVAVLFGIFYGITVLITNKKEQNKPTGTTEPKIEYDKILLGNLFKQKEDKYYVFISDQDDENIAIYESYLQVYSKLDKHDMVYYSVLNHPMNAQFKGDKTNTNVTNILDLKVKGTTLVYVEKGKITKTYDTEEKLLNYLKEITKKEDTKEDTKK